MKFFTSHDFDRSCDYEDMARKANAKLEREGRTVWGIQNLIGNPKQDTPGPAWSSVGKFGFPNDELAYTAILINIQPIKTCGHSKEEVTFSFYSSQYDPPEDWAYICRCGAKVQPSNFEEVK